MKTTSTSMWIHTSVKQILTDYFLEQNFKFLIRTKESNCTKKENEKLMVYSTRLAMVEMTKLKLCSNFMKF